MLDTIQDFMPIILNGVGGAVLGPVMAKLIGSRGGVGAVLGVIAGAVGGVGAGQATEFINVDLANFMGGGDMMRVLADLLEGAIGGGILGLFAGRISK